MVQNSIWQQIHTCFIACWNLADQDLHISGLILKQKHNTRISAQLFLGPHKGGTGTLFHMDKQSQMVPQYWICALLKAASAHKAVFTILLSAQKIFSTSCPKKESTRHLWSSRHCKQMSCKNRIYTSQFYKMTKHKHVASEEIPCTTKLFCSLLVDKFTIHIILSIRQSKVNK